MVLTALIAGLLLVGLCIPGFLLEKSIFFVITLLTNKRNYDIIDLLLVEAHFAISIPSCKRLSEAETEERGGCRSRLAERGRSGNGK